MSKFIIDGDTMQGIADAIRGKTGSSEQLTPADMITAIAGLAVGGGTKGVSVIRTTMPASSTALNVSHKLESSDIVFAACFVENLNGITPPAGTTVGKVFVKTDLKNSKDMPGYSVGYAYTADGKITMFAQSALAYGDGLYSDSRPDIFSFNMAGSKMNFAKGLTYTSVFISTDAFEQN